jgi:hypothetical protein
MSMNLTSGEIASMTRRRGILEYLLMLCIDKPEYDRIAERTANSPARILLVGGGASPIQKHLGPSAVVTNIDPFPPSESLGDAADAGEVATETHVADFTEYPVPANTYDEVWALYSLPLYATSTAGVKIALAKAVLALKSGGKARIFPIGQCPTLYKRLADRARIEATDNALADLSGMAGCAISVCAVHQDIDPIALFDTPDELFSTMAKRFARLPCRVAGGSPIAHEYITRKGGLTEIGIMHGEEIAAYSQYETAVIKAPEDPSAKAAVDRELRNYISRYAEAECERRAPDLTEWREESVRSH